MPSKPKSHSQLQREKYEPVYQASPDRTEAHRFYNRQPWLSTRLAILWRDPLCLHCKAKGIDELSTEVDHVIDRLLRPDLAFDESNLQGLCKPCHSRKTIEKIR